jgi:surfeit locus 1 family protein
MGRGRRAALLAGTLGVAAICGALGAWQSARYLEAREWIAASSARMQEPPIPLDDALADPAGAEWRRVVAAGRLETRETVLLEHQSRMRADGRALESGVKVITPLRTAQGALLLVDRGFLSAERADAFRAGDVPPGEWILVGVLRALERRTLHGTRVARRERWHRVDLAGLEAQLGETLLPWLLVQTEAGPGATPEPVPPAPAARVDHRNYAITWFGVAAVALGAGGAAAWRAARAP